LDVHGRYAGHLRIRHEGHWSGFLTHLCIFAVLRHTNNGVGCAKVVLTSLKPDMVSKRISSAKISFNKRLIDYHHLLSSCRIGFCEVATHHQISPENMEVVWTDKIPAHRGKFVAQRIHTIHLCSGVVAPPCTKAIAHQRR